MSLVRASALRSIQTSLRHSSARVTARAAPSRTQLVAKRFASSGGHGEHASSSDLPWLLGGIAVTVPACYYLWPAPSHADSGHHGASHDSGDGHAEEHKEEEDAEDAPAEEEKEDDEKPAQEDQSKADDQEDSKDGGDSDGEEKGKDDSEDGEEEDSKAEKSGKVSADSEGASNTHKSEPEPKGGSKKRVDSGLAKNLGEGSSSKESLSSTSKKQAGMSNTDTRHSLQIDQDAEKSKKSEGAPETAKLKGPVDPARGQK